MQRRRRRVSCPHQPKGICPPCRRAQCTAYARRDRLHAQAERNATTTTCQHRHGQGRCGAMLEHRTDTLGRVETTCPKCERRRAGICRDCPRAVAGQRGKAVRCAECRDRAIAACLRAYEDRNRELLRRRARRSYQRSRAERRRRAEYKRRWRKLNPDKVRAQKRREALRQSAHTRAYMQAYRERRKRERADLEVQRYYVEQTGGVLTHACTGGCGNQLTGRAKKCDRCKQRDIATALTGERAA